MKLRGRSLYPSLRGAVRLRCDYGDLQCSAVRAYQHEDVTNQCSPKGKVFKTWLLERPPGTDTQVQAGSVKRRSPARHRTGSQDLRAFSPGPRFTEEPATVAWSESVLPAEHTVPHARYMRTSQTPLPCVPFVFVLRNVWEGQGETDTRPFDTAPGKQPLWEEKQHKQGSGQRAQLHLHQHYWLFYLLIPKPGPETHLWSTIAQ